MEIFLIAKRTGQMNITDALCWKSGCGGEVNEYDDKKHSWLDFSFSPGDSEYTLLKYGQQQQVVI